MKVKLKNTRVNPFRDIDRYPINREKVEHLKNSLDTTEFWDNILGREIGNGIVEFAYGTHRRVALLEKYGAEHEIDIPVRPLTDAMMLKIMANENNDYWEQSALVQIETVAAVVKAFAQGRIELEKPDDKHNKGELRYAPGYIPGKRSSAGTSLPYNALTVGRFIGWVGKKTGQVSDKVDNALTALQYIEEGLITINELKELGSRGLRAVIAAAREARKSQETSARLAEQQAKQATTPEKAAAHRKEAESHKEQAKRQAKVATRAAVRAVVDEKRGLAEDRAKDAARRAVAEEAGHPKDAHKLPEIRQLVEALGKELYKVLGKDDVRRLKVEEICKFRDATNVAYLIKALRALSERAIKLANALSEPTNNGDGKPVKSASLQQLNYELFKD